MSQVGRLVADCYGFDSERLVQRGILVDHAVFYGRSDAADVADMRARITVHEASGVTSKAANGGHFKTGQRKLAWD